MILNRKETSQMPHFSIRRVFRRSPFSKAN